MTVALDAARHEAGHAVASFLLGREVLAAGIEEHGDEVGGYVRERAPGHEPGHLGNHVHPWRLDALDEAVVVLAGPICEGREPDRESSDVDTAMRLCRGISHTEPEFQACAKYVIERVRSMVMHPHFVCVFEHLVNALLRDRVMTGADVKRECQRAQLRYAEGRLHDAA